MSFKFQDKSGGQRYVISTESANDVVCRLWKKNKSLKQKVKRSLHQNSGTDKKKIDDLSSFKPDMIFFSTKTIWKA